MRTMLKIVGLGLFIAFAGCSGTTLFSSYAKEEFPTTRVTENAVKTVQILNDSPTDIKHVINIGYFADTNSEGHFQISEVRVGAEKVDGKDIYIPPLSSLNIDITYAPLDLETNEVAFAGWTTTIADRGEPVLIDSGSSSQVDGKAAVMAMALLSKETKTITYNPAIHRTVMIVAFDKPAQGYSNIELVGAAIPGPNGEDSAVAMGTFSGEECVAAGSTACFKGSFAIDLPGLMSGGAIEVPMTGPIKFKIEGSALELNMDDFPPILIALQGNGPGEPLEGQPVDALSIIVSGTPEVISTGSFDGSNLSLSAVGFRIRVLLGAITEADITPGLQAAVDFNIEDLDIETEDPFDGNRIIFGVLTTLSSSPSGNSLFDGILGNAQVIVKFTGTLETP